MKVHRLHLTPEQAAWLRERGRHFIVVTPGSYPTNPGGFDLCIVECGESAAVDACHVAMGRARARRVKD